MSPRFSLYKNSNRPCRLPVNGALVELGVLPGRGVDRVDVDDGHLLVQNFGAGLDQLPGFAVQAGALQKQACGKRKKLSD